MPLPYHPPRYATGPSTPRTTRWNDALWDDLTVIARRRGINTTLLVRAVLEDFLEAYPNDEMGDRTESDMRGEDHA